ncbi:MAG: hypothetical protein JWN43_1152 [Gammaproteobacteria bacterium]|nr:hypothetical protein [Gammaproteobacteria bacterium]
MPKIFIYQILNHYTTPDALDPGFLVLDNSTNERPDWFEYWPIRKFLLSEPLDEDAFYGFLSPKFKLKTNLSAAAAHEFVSLETKATDVVLLSQSVHQAASYLNTFQYGDSRHPGLVDVAMRFLDRIGSPADLQTLVTHSRNEVYSNYMVAKPRFWRAWLEITEQLFVIAESPADPLGAELRKATLYRGRREVPMKIFIMERIAALLLARDSAFVARARDPFAARSRVYKLPMAITCDALKIAYATNGGKEEYRALFRIFSKFARIFSWQIRIGNALGIEPIRSSLRSLASRWEKAGRS